MKSKLLVTALLLFTLSLGAQQLVLMDRFNGNKIVNDSTVTVFNSDINVEELTQYFTMKNNTDRTLAVFLRKTVHIMSDSTTDYFCFGIRCWPDTDTTDIADTIQPGAEDYTFASHACHERRFEERPCPPGLTKITYTIFDDTSFPQPVEASVTVIYHNSGLGLEDEGKGTKGEKGMKGGLLAVYPNPASDWLTVETGETKPGKYTLLIYNYLGLQVNKTSIRLEDNRLRIPVNGFLPGVYIGKLFSEQGPGAGFRFQVGF